MYHFEVLWGRGLTPAQLEALSAVHASFCPLAHPPGEPEGEGVKCLANHFVPVILDVVVEMLGVAFVAGATDPRPWSPDGTVAEQADPDGGLGLRTVPPGGAR